MSTIQTLNPTEIAEVSGAGFSLNLGGLLDVFASSSISITHTEPNGSSTTVDIDNNLDTQASGFLSILFGKNCCCTCTPTMPL